MPCYDDRDNDRSQMAKLQVRNEKLTSMLCMVLSTLEDENELGHFLELFNYNEAGIPRKYLVDWWEQHKEDDRRRKEYERAQRELQDKKKAALDKLTPEERHLLGI